MENRKNELISFWRKSGKLIESGVPLLHTLETIAKETQNVEFKTVVENLKISLLNGASLAEALAKSSGWFSASVQDIIRVGELQGTLDKAVLKVIEGLQDGTFTINESSQLESLAVLQNKDTEDTIKTVNRILLKGFENRASDIHFEPVEDKMRIRYRIDGILQEMESLPKEIEEAILARIKGMANMNLAEKNVRKTEEY